MKRIVGAMFFFLALQPVVAGEAQSAFQGIADRLTALVQKATLLLDVTRDDKSFLAESDTMVYTVHGGRASSGFWAQTYLETGPRYLGFVINVSVVPLNPIAGLSGQTRQQPYWREFTWTGHGDKEECIQFVFKFGERVDAEFKSRIIEAVTRGAQPRPERDILTAERPWHGTFVQKDVDGKLIQVTVWDHGRLLSCWDYSPSTQVPLGEVRVNESRWTQTVSEGNGRRMLYDDRGIPEGYENFRNGEYQGGGG